MKDTPAACDAQVGLVALFEVLKLDVLEAMASKGLDIPDDLKVGAGLKHPFSYVRDVIVAAIEQDAADIKADSAELRSTDASLFPFPAAELAAAPGLLNANCA
jgi:hypothetical protein